MGKNKPLGPGPGVGGGHEDGRMTQRQGADKLKPGRGSSKQGELQNAKGGPAGANQGGASRGGSRVEPSHQQRAAKQARAKR